MLVIGIDPSTKRCGLAVIDPDTRTLLHAELLESKHDDARLRIKEIFEMAYERISMLDPELEVEVYCESTVMRGKGGETLARVTGALMAAVPFEFHFEFMHNVSMKKAIGGHGKAEKDEVAHGVANWFGACGADDRSWERVCKLWEAEAYDITDAIGIAIAGWERRHGKEG